jgi:uncharacterized membrane protein YuzA (DUF378 family)
MQKLSSLDWVALVLVIVGGLNWGLVALAELDLVQTLVGAWPVVAKAVYVLVALSALYLATIAKKLSKA